MFSKIAFALTGLLTLVAADPLPGTVIISVVDSTGTILGTLNGYGNFSSPGPSYPFRTSGAVGDYSFVTGYELCSVLSNGIGSALSCSGESTDAAYFTVSPGSIFKILYRWLISRSQDAGGNFVLNGTDGTWSVDNAEGSGGGTNPIGLNYGIPVYLGNVGAVPVTLAVNAASG